MEDDFDRLIDDALDALWRRNPVTATFAGEHGRDALLPRADAAAESNERREIAALAERLAAVRVPGTAAARIDARHLGAYCALEATAFAADARYRNPAWYTGEAAFGVISLLLAAGDPRTHAPALAARVRALPDFLNDAAQRLDGAAVPAAWTQRALTELGALERLVGGQLAHHPAGSATTANEIAGVGAACRKVRDAFARLMPDPSDGACGEDHLALILERVHGLRESPAQLERRAANAFSVVRDELEAQARALDPAVSWRTQMARLATIGPAQSDVLDSYARWHERALRDSSALLAPAGDYTLTFAPLPEWSTAVADDLYFLWYRAPAAREPGTGSTYWVSPPDGTPDEIRRAHNTAAVKLVHAVHHGSVGHHTQNARARRAPSRFARIAGTDGASAIALLAGGTMVEGWACYAEDLMAETEDFYTPAERLQLTYFELRNIASCIADIRFHTRRSTLEEMQSFYRDEANFAPSRLVAETTRNSIFPGSRVMYWSGSQQIKALRARSALPARTFHDRLLDFGATPVAWIAEELA